MQSVGFQMCIVSSVSGSVERLMYSPTQNIMITPQAPSQKPIYDDAKSSDPSYVVRHMKAINVRGLFWGDDITTGWVRQASI
jgi:hypothetical protein